MRCSLFRPLAAALLLAVASVPCPASWLDDTTYNVGVEAILAPRGTIDSGSAITIPCCVVANRGDSAAALWTFFAIDNGGPLLYFDSLQLPSLRPGARETVAFRGWAACGRDSMTATAWTVCAGDTFPNDDTCRVKFLVRAFLIELEITVPRNGDTLDLGEVFYQQVKVWNYSNFSLNMDIRFTIGGYRFTRNIDLIAGGATVVTSPFLETAMPPGGCVIIAAAARERVFADTSWYYVRGGAGVEETANGEGRKANGGPTILSGSMVHSLESMVIFDAMGRRVVNPRSGVYFVRAVSGRLSAVSCRKVILQR